MPEPRLIPVLAILLGAVACSEREPEAEQPWNLIVISIDSLRADRLHCYGYPRETSPAIDRLAEQSQVFEARAPSPWTLPTHASLMTSLYARSHGVRDARQSLADDVPTFAEVLSAEGYRTAAVVSGPFMRRQFGLDRGFHEYDDTVASGKHRQSHRAVTSPEVHAKGVDVLRRLSPEGPFFLFLHYWDVHYDYVPPAEYAERFDPDYEGAITSSGFIQNKEIHAGMASRDLEHLNALYDGEIAWVDHFIGQLVQELRDLELLDRTVLVLTSDHGDEFFEHGEKGHQHSLYEELLRVPLIVRIPDAGHARHSDSSVSLIDLMPTLLELLRIEVPAGLDGVSFVPLILGGGFERPPIFADTAKGRKKRGRKQSVETWCVLLDDQKLILFADDKFPPELYDLATDPHESDNRYDADEHLALRGVLDEWLASEPRSAARTLSADAPGMEDLKTLGYVNDDE